MDATFLARIEQLCRIVYSGSPEEGITHADANAQLMVLQQGGVDNIPQTQFILDNSNQAFAQVFASQALEVLLSQFWNNFTNEQRIEIRNYVLTFLATRAGSLNDFVVQSLCKLSARVTKLGWFDSAEHREIIQEASKFIEATVDHHDIGLKLLHSLVDEMNIPTVGRTLTIHRKTAVSFRDHALFQTFQIAITALRQLQLGTVQQTPEQQEKTASLALSLANTCLSFDFIGTNPEESAEDVGTVQVPSSWRPIVQDTATMQLFFDFYRISRPPRSNLALQALTQLSSVRRSLFASEKERCAFLQVLISGIHEIMSTKKGLEEEENYHEFCRLLGRLKASFQLSELVKTTGFTEWLDLAREFTVLSLQQWRCSMNSIHYLLALWGRLVAALPYLRSDSTVAPGAAVVAGGPCDVQRHATSLRLCVLNVVESYIQTMLDSVQIVVESDGAIEDPLSDEGSLKEAMDRLPVIARLQYEVVAEYLIRSFEQALGMYEQTISAPPSQMMAKQSIILEGRMTWLMHISAAVIGWQSSPDPRKGQGELIWDGSLCRCAFRLVNIVDKRLASSNGQGKADSKLEIAILSFFKSFKKVYMMDSVSGPSIGLIPGGLPAHPLLSLALSAGGAREEEKESMTIYDAMREGDMTSVMNLVVDKMCNNIKYWHSEDEVLKETLEVFVDLVSTYSSSKTLLGLETVNFLVQHHDGANFPFLGYNNNNKHRITFYSALSRLVFTSSEDLNNCFEQFLSPNLAILAQLHQAPDLRTEPVRVAIIGILRDLKGIALSTYNKRTYNLLFDALYPSAFPLIVRIAETWYDNPEVMTALFKFMQEFVYNKGQRIFFDQSSANGILLFRETSTIVCAYGSRILQLPVQQDIYKEKYKCIRLMLNTLSAAFSGGYVNFGVFALYQDQALQNSLDVSLQMCLQIPLSDVMAYVKLSKSYFQYLEVLFRSHLDVLCGLDAPIFLQLVKAVHEGLTTNGTCPSPPPAPPLPHYKHTNTQSSNFTFTNTLFYPSFSTFTL